MQRVVTWLVLVAYVALAAGLPLPAGMLVDAARPSLAAGLLAAKDRSRPFPCMNSPCGCVSAERCFRECCCHSVAERIAWARRHDLEAEVLAALERRVATNEPRSAGKPRERCCTEAAPTPGAESLPVAARQASCRRRATEDGRGGPSEVASPEDDDRPRSVAEHGETSPRGSPRDVPRRGKVTLRAMLACQGIVAQWVSAAGTLPPARVEAGSIAPPCGVVELLDAAADSPPRVPEAPPPEAA